LARDFLHLIFLYDHFCVWIYFLVGVNFNWRFFNLLGNFDLEGISTGGSVLHVVILGNDLELSGMLWSIWLVCIKGRSRKAVKQTWSISKRFIGSCVIEVLERNKSVGKITIGNGELHNTFLWSEYLEVWSHAGKLSL